MTKHLKKTIFMFLFIVLVIPQITFAAWWNPFTWHWPWAKKVSTKEQVQQTTLVIPVEEESSKERSLQEDKMEITPKVNFEEKKTSIPIKSTPTITAVSLYTPPATPIVVISPTVDLSISDVSIDEESNSVRVNWKTNIPSESKILFEGKSYFSKRGVGTIHYVDIDGLESDLYYIGTITAIANNAWKDQNFNFTTKSNPLKITVTRQGCLADTCTLSWETNYKSDSRIKIYKTDSSQIIKSLKSPSENTREHSLEFKLEPNTKYTFEIYSTSDNESADTTGKFETLNMPASCNGCVSA